MDLAAYRARRDLLREQELSRGRKLCFACLQPPFGCYCAEVRPFDPQILFTVLIHPLEARRKIATGRMAHLCLKGSKLLRGQDFSGSASVDALVSDPDLHPVVLYPGPESIDLSAVNAAERRALIPPGKRLAVFVLDGTWWTARKMIRSRNLASLPRIAFSPDRPSRFRVRKQPKPECWSTIEAIHETIELLGEAAGFAVASRAHDALLDVFDGMVRRQLRCANEIGSSRHVKKRAAGA